MGEVGGEWEWNGVEWERKWRCEKGENKRKGAFTFPTDPSNSTTWISVVNDLEVGTAKTAAKSKAKTKNFMACILL